jgi:hypothetical protein
MSLSLQRRFALARDKRRAMKSRVNREVQARFREGLGAKSPGAYSKERVKFQRIFCKYLKNKEIKIFKI